MKSIIALTLLVVFAAAAPLDQDKDAVVLKSVNDNIGVGNWHHQSELSNGNKAEEHGEIVDQGTENEAIKVTGSFSWVDQRTGLEYTINYVADENGFQPQGAHLPVAPQPNA